MIVLHPHNKAEKPSCHGIIILRVGMRGIHLRVRDAVSKAVYTAVIIKGIPVCAVPLIRNPCVALHQLFLLLGSIKGARKKPLERPYRGQYKHHNNNKSKRDFLSD